MSLGYSKSKCKSRADLICGGTPLPVTTIFCVSHSPPFKLTFNFISHLRSGLPLPLWNSLGCQAVSLDVHRLTGIIATWSAHLCFDSLILFLMSSVCVYLPSNLDLYVSLILSLFVSNKGVFLNRFLV